MVFNYRCCLSFPYHLTIQVEFIAIWMFYLIFVFALQVDAVLDKENFTLEELLDEDEIIQECKALNGRLIN